jgi:hypothetical protein
MKRFGLILGTLMMCGAGAQAATVFAGSDSSFATPAVSQTGDRPIHWFLEETGSQLILDSAALAGPDSSASSFTAAIDAYNSPVMSVAIEIPAEPVETAVVRRKVVAALRRG